MLRAVRCVFAIGAHPDDVEYGCLGTLLKIGPDVSKHVFIASLGSAGDATATPARADESRRALECLGADELHIRPEAGISTASFEVIEQDLHRRLTAADPHLILTHGPQDTHQEHRLVWDITQAAARQLRATILQYATASSTTDFAPDVFVDVSDQYDVKRAALAAHVSQARKHYMSDAQLRLFHGNAYAGRRGLPCTEAFRLVRAFW